MMQAVRTRARWLRRSHRGATLGLLVLTGLAAGLVLGSWGAARRSGSTFDRLIDHAAQADAVVYVCSDDLTNACTQQALDGIRALPAVESAARIAAVPVLYEFPDGSTLDGSIEAMLDDGFPTAEGIPIVVDGRLIEAGHPAEVLVPDVQALGLSAGDELTITPIRLGPGFEPTLMPELRQTLRLAGIVRTPSSLTASSGVITADPAIPAVGPGWWREYGTRMTPWEVNIAIRAKPGATVDELRSAVARALQNRRFSWSTFDRSEQSKVDDAIGYETTATMLFAVAVAVAALVFVGQALTRQAGREAADQEVMAALGATHRDLGLAALWRAIPVALGAAVLACGIAWLSSAFTPVGLGGRAETDPGLRPDPLVLAVGGAAVAACTLACLTLPSLTAGRSRRWQRHPGPGWLTERAALPPVARAGVTVVMPGRRAGFSLRTATVGLIVVIAAGVAATVLVGSLDRLLSRPGDYGVTWDAEVSDFLDEEQVDRATTILLSDPAVASVANRRVTHGTVDGEPAVIAAYEHISGDPTVPWPTILEGREPLQSGEVALGRTLMSRLGAKLDDVVVIETEADPTPLELKVVGVTVVNAGSSYDAGESVLVPAAALQGGTGVGREPLVRFAPDADRARLDASLAEIGVGLAEPFRQAGIRNLARVRWVPWALVAVIVVLAAAALIHALVLAVRRRRGQLAILRSLGFTTGQTAGAVVAGAAFLGLVALAIGVPVGIGLGRWAWAALARGVGVGAQPAMPLAIGLVVVLAVLAGISLVAIGPGWRAARLRSADALRGE